MKRILALYSLLSIFTINLVGKLKYSEVLAFLYLPFMLQLLKNVYYKKYIFLLIYFLLIQLVSDISINHNSIENTLKGSALILSAIVVYMFFLYNIKSAKDVLLLLIINSITAFFSRSDVPVNDINYYKLVIVPSTVNVAWYLLCYFYTKGKIYLSYMVLIIFSILTILYDARSISIICLITILILLVKRNIRYKLSRKKVVFPVIFLLLVTQILYVFYVNKVLDSTIGSDRARQQLRRVENPYNPLYLIVTGRAEVFASFYAIADAPFFGHGSWAEDKNLKYTSLVYDLHKEEINNEVQSNKQLIPTHSILFGAWVYYGVGGFLIIFLLYVYLLKIGLYHIKHSQYLDLYPVIVFWFIELNWIFLFSPIQHLKISIPFYAAVFSVFYSKSKRNIIDMSFQKSKKLSLN